MKIHYKHLLNFLIKKPNKNSLSEKLFQLGHEHTITGDIFDLEITPNRGDCLSLNGLARDLGVFFGKKQDFNIYEGSIDHFEFNFTNNQKISCPKVSFLKIEICEDLEDYKDYLESYFNDLNINKTNFFSDVSNYISYEFGQPTHCYDFSHIGSGLTLDKSKGKESFKTLTGKEIILDADTLIFLSNDKPVSLAGIMGSDDSKCTALSKSVLIECAHFKPESILGKTVKYDLSSEAAHKFERFVDPNLQEFILRRFIQIISDHSKIMNFEICSFGDNFKMQKISFKEQIINDILGTKIANNKIKNILESLDIKISDHDALVPSFRNDIQSMNDLSEEVARVEGYDNIQEKPLALKEIKDIDGLEFKIKDLLISHGFYETLNNQFAENGNKYSIKIDNPLDSKNKFLRSSLKDSLIRNLEYNENRQKDSIKFFEISDIYKLNSRNDIDAKKMIGIIASGKVGKNYIDFSKNITQKYINQIFQKIHFDIEPYIQVINRSGIKSKKKAPVFFIEIDYEKLEDSLKTYALNAEKKVDFPTARKVSDFPSSFRDFSFLVDSTESAESLAEIIIEHKFQNIKDIFLFDFYKNENNNKIKVAYRFIFQSLNKTLTEKEINDEIKPLLDKVLKLENVSIPGYEFH